MKTKSKEWSASPFKKGTIQKPKAKAQNPTTIEEAFTLTTPMVHKLAKKWTRNHFQHYDDFVSEGYVGILEAWKRFDGTEYQTKGYRFTTYSWLWIRAMMKDYANRLWKYQNNTQTASETNMDNRTYELSIDAISVKVMFEKLTPEDQELLRMKMDGFTFEEIAGELGFETLHKARRQFLEVSESLG
jgi:RNA polymerase sigma factor (sigma-70 family)